MPLPLEDLDDLSFDDILNRAVSRIPLFNPVWTDFNYHDPGITLVELFSWLTEMQLYRLNRIPKRSYRKFLALTGIPSLRPAQPARTTATFSAVGIAPIVVPRDTRLTVTSLADGGSIAFTTTRDLTVLKNEIRSILTVAANSGVVENVAANGNDAVYYYPFGSTPVEGDAFQIGFDADLNGSETALTFTIWERGMGPSTPWEGTVLSVVLQWRYLDKDGVWQPLPVEDGTMCLTRSGTVTFTVPGPMKGVDTNGRIVYWVMCLSRKAQFEARPACADNPLLYDSPPKIDSIAINTVSAIQRSEVRSHSQPHTGLPDFRLVLPFPPILAGSLQINGGAWSEVEDLDASGPEDLHFTADVASGEICFGDGVHGALPEEGTIITALYRTGGGAAGNVGPGTVTVESDALAGAVEAVIAAAAGGQEAETLDAATARAREDVTSVSRAVTTEDFEAILQGLPGDPIARAAAIPGYHPGRAGNAGGVVSIIVVPRSDSSQPTPSVGLLKTVYRYLEQYRLLGTELFVLAPSYVDVTVKAHIAAQPRNTPDAVERRAREALNTFLHPLLGGTDGTGWPFGRSVYVSEIYQLLAGVDGVDHVSSIFIEDSSSTGFGNVAIPRHALVCSRDHEITVEGDTGDGHA